MRTCPNCDFKVADEAVSCPMCGTDIDEALAAITGAEELPEMELATRDESISVIPPSKVVVYRADGTAPMAIGWVCFAIAVICFFVAVTPSTPTYSYGAPSLSEIRGAQQAYLATLGTGAFFSLFLVFWSVGYIVRAISHLPGKADQ